MSTTTTDDRSVILLNQVIAIRAGVKNDTSKALIKYHNILKRSEMLRGQSRTYKSHDDEGFVYPAENQNVQIKATQVLDSITKDLARLFDVTAMMDWTNQQARADIVIWSGDDPVVLAHDVPVSYLMFLEKQLVELNDLIRNLPVLEANENWTFDPTQDVYRSDNVGTVKSKKVRRNHVVAPATDKHPAQVEVFTEDEPIGTWTTVKFSGALPPARVNKMLARVKTLTEAVKFAREKANVERIQDPKPGRQILDYIFNVED